MPHLNRARHHPGILGLVEKTSVLPWARRGHSKPEETSGGGSPSNWSMLQEGVWQGCTHPGMGPSRSLFQSPKPAPEVKNEGGWSGFKAAGYKHCCWCSGGQETPPEHNHPQPSQRCVWLCDGTGGSSRCKGLHGEWA